MRPLGRVAAAVSRRALLVGGCGAVAVASLPGCGRREETLRLGLPPWPANDLYLLAEHLGAFEGVPIRIVDYTSAAQGLQAVRGGLVEIYPCTLDEALLLASDLPDLRIVQVLDSSVGADVILAHPDVASLPALRGRRIGYEATALGSYVLGRALSIGGLTPADITPVFLQVDEHERAFVEHRVDAVVTYEPVRSRLLATGAAHVVFDSTQIPGEIVDVLVTFTRWIDRRLDALVAVVRGWLLAAERLTRSPDEVVDVLSRRLSLPPERVLTAYAGIDLVDLAGNLDLLGGPAPGLVAVARRLAEAMVANRFLDQVPDLERLLDPRVVARIPVTSGG